MEEDGTGGMTGYADADGQMQEDRRAISGYAFLIDGGARLVVFEEAGDHFTIDDRK